jgi:putative membrane protein
MLAALLLWGGDGGAAVPHLFWHRPLWGRLWIGLIVGGTWLVARGGGRGRGRFGPERAAEVLAERYARGEASTDEWRERLSHLYGSGL